MSSLMGILEDFSLESRVALITGAARGLGQGIVLGLAEAVVSAAECVEVN